MIAGLTKNKIIVTAACLLLVSVSLHGQDEREYIRKGNRLYKKGEYAGSEGMYRRAQVQEKQADDSGFNLGDALYKQGRFGEATAEFGKAATTSKGDTLKHAQSLYNLGNSLLKEQKFEESIKAYINSLMLNPDNMEAKYNLAYAQDQLRKQEEQEKQQQQQDQNKENKEDQQEKSDQDKQQNQDDQQQQQQDRQPTISREDAKRLLDALAANEKDTQEKVQRDKAAKAKVRVIKNW
ncbi:MAG: tetratricopeptide repeat protein [Bacteroidales bacterium]